jgi:hypothetical protein
MALGLTQPLGPAKIRKVRFKTATVFTRITVQYFGASGGTVG